MSRSKALQYYVVARLLLAPLMLWTIVTIVFLLLRATPGDPIDAILGGRAPEEVKAELRERLGFNAPLWLQYVTYLGKLLQLDLGTSLSASGKSVWSIVQEHFPATVELAVFSMAIAVIVGVAIGIFSASRPGTIIDASGRLFGIISYSLPMFWVGMLLQLIFAVQLDWFPAQKRFPEALPPPETITGLFTIDSLLHGDLGQFFTSLYYLALPSLTLGILLSGIFERIVRVNLKQTLKADYVEAARARGVGERRIIMAHALKNALIPVITILGLTLASLLGGAVLTEVTFSWPGLGNRLFEAIVERDYPTVQGVMVFFAAIVVIASIAIDVLNAYIDPRIRY
ncbi:MAG: ABC transporter permease [Cyanosarcina radialis HA8281-LM2]|jgi:peptide/nickel transport system permease protein|nr:ABC transporter permease [Cyanosarcina radialis HA8281-LM2]